MVRLPARAALLAVAAAALVVFAAFGVLAIAPWPAVRQVDAGPPAAGHAIALRYPVIRLVATVVTDVGSPLAVDVVAGTVAAYLLLTRRWRPATAVIVARLGELACESATKALVDRPRPALAPVLTSASGMSFPSGHSAGSAAVYGVTAMLAATILTKRHARHLLALTTVFVILVAATRVLLGVHYPTDVLAGLALGTAWAAAALAVVAAPRKARSGSTFA